MTERVSKCAVVHIPKSNIVIVYRYYPQELVPNFVLQYTASVFYTYCMCFSQRASFTSEVQK